MLYNYYQLSITKAFSSPRTDSLYLLSSSFPFSTLALGCLLIPFISMNLPIIDNAYK